MDTYISQQWRRVQACLFPPKLEAFQEAAKTGDTIKLLQCLESKYLDVNAITPRDDETVLFKATDYSQMASVSLLLKHGADLERTSTKFRSTPLHRAVKNGDLPMTLFLLKHGANVNALELHNMSPLHFAAMLGHLDVMAALLDNSPGADLHIRNIDGATPIISAARNNNQDGIRLLLHRGASLEERQNDGTTPLLAAIQYQQYDMVKLLLSLGADTMATGGYDEFTAVHFAAAAGSERMLKLLFEHGACCLTPSRSGRTPLDVCMSHLARLLIVEEQSLLLGSAGFKRAVVELEDEEEEEEEEEEDDDDDYETVSIEEEDEWVDVTTAVLC